MAGILINPPSKEDMIVELRRIADKSPDGRVSMRVFREQTGWDRYWFDKHWPLGGYQAACVESGVKRGKIIGIDTSVRVGDEELAAKFAEAVQTLGTIPSLKRLQALARIGGATFTRGETYAEAKKRVIRAYFELPSGNRCVDPVEDILRAELVRLDGHAEDHSIIDDKPSRSIRVTLPEEYISLVQEFRDRGEEEKRQLVAQFFYQILGYRRVRVRSEHKHNDVRVHDRRDQPWIVVEVKQRLESERDRRAARRQCFDYAHRHGIRIVVISDSDYYEVFDRCCGERLRYDEMRLGTFQILSIRSRDSDLLELLTSER